MGVSTGRSGRCRNGSCAFAMIGRYLDYYLGDALTKNVHPPHRGPFRASFDPLADEDNGRRLTGTRRLGHWYVQVKL
jgi:hypothetical protein